MAIQKLEIMVRLARFFQTCLRHVINSYRETNEEYLEGP